MLIIYLCLFFIGASIASFINASIYRLENGYKYPEIITKNSHCEKCNKQLKWYELFPIFGYLFIGGRCKNCKAKINSYYPISELILGLVFILSYYYSLPIYLYSIYIYLFVLTYYDVKDNAVYKTLIHIFLALCLLIFILFRFEFNNILLPTAIVCAFLILNLFKKSFGGGDLFLLVGLGMLFSPSLFVVFFWLSIFISLIYSLLFAIIKKKKIRNLKIPMIPFLSISFFLTLLYGEKIYLLLLNLMGL